MERRIGVCNLCEAICGLVLEVDGAAVLAILQGHAAGLGELVSLAGSLPRSPATEQALQLLEQAIAAIRRATRGG